MRTYSFLILFLLGSFAMSAQMQKNGQTLYGNEWISYNKNYIKVQVDEDGLYVISYNNLTTNGYTAQQLVGSSFKMYSNGEEVPLYIANNGLWSATDFLVFYGEQNDGEVDSYMFKNADEQQINPEVSMYSAVRTYYLVLEPNGNNLRYETKPNNINGSGLNKESYYIDILKEVYNDAPWSPSAPTDRDLEFSNFIGMDGFASRMTNEHILQFDLVNHHKAGPDPSIKMRMGSNNSSHFVQLEFNNNPILNDNFSGSLVKKYDIEFDKANLKSGTNVLKLRGLSTADNLSIGSLELHYPRTYDADNASTYEFFSGQDNLDEYVEVPNFTGAAKNFVFDINNGYVVIPELTGKTAKFVMAGGPVPGAKLILINGSQFKAPLSFERMNFKQVENLNPEYLILTSEELNKIEGGRNMISEYETFRSSQLGGNYKTAILNVEDLYDQFGYGIDKHSIAIKNFSAYIRDKWPAFKMVFIIGKGLSFQNTYRNTIAKNYVPTYGKPGSDNLLFAEIGKPYPYVGVGRLAAQNQDEIKAYFDKAKTNAVLSDVGSLTIEQRLWLKNIMHLSGGDPKIQEEIFNQLSQMKATIENNKYAGIVTTYRKNSSDPVTTALTEQILSTINNGISLLTFFGHSSAGTFDFSVEDPSKYMNFDKHPVVLSMGCHSGDIHESIFSLSEDFILTEELGAVAFMASSGNAYPEPLSEMGKAFYDVIGEGYYGEPISLAMRQVLENMNNIVEASYQNTSKTLSLEDTYASIISLLQQNTLHGDPAVSFFYAAAPDYVVDLATITTMDVVGTSDKNIELGFDILNLGAGLNTDSLSHYIVHNYGTDLSDTIYFKSGATKNRDHIKIKIPNPGKLAVGKNTINIVLDYDNKVVEAPSPIAEQNNDLTVAYSIPDGYTFYIFDNSAIPIYPTEFSIVGKQGITLKASAPNALGNKDYFLIEVDTTETFDSPFLRSVELHSHPGLIEWEPNILYKQETVYYWRVKPKNNVQAIWNNSSFVYLDQVPGGWNQSHFYQWTHDETKTAYIDSTSRDLTYVSNINDIRIGNGVYPNFRPFISHQDNTNKFIEFGDEIISGIYISTFDGVSGIPMYNKPNPGDHGSHIMASWVGDDFFCFPYKMNTKDQRAKAINFIENVIPDGNYVSIITMQRVDFGAANYRPERWADDSAQGGTDMMTVLEKYGAKQVRSLANNAVPYLFVFKKNDTSWEPIERVALNQSDEIDAEFKILARWHEGEIRSTTIGPASQWDKLIWNIDEIDFQEDSYKLDIIGCNSTGEEALLYENVDEFDFDLSGISATAYPNIKLNLYTNDDISKTSPQMEFWRVHYTGLPEAVLNIDSRFVFDRDTIPDGNNFRFSTVATNITNADMDSLVVEYTIIDKNNQEHKTEQTLAPLKAFETINLDFESSVSDLLGLNDFKVEINPRELQKEQFYFNNLGLRSFLVLGDTDNPILDVTFDGVRILDEDIVSPSPTISVTLKDDNIFNPITDLSSFDLALIKEPSNQSATIPLDGENITFYPADSTNNFCARIEYTPEFESGEYTLIVQGKDASGNLSGDQAYTVKFKVVVEASVSKVLNYPNPFSTSTEFIFTLTGNEVPEEFSIQIFSMSGKVVKEITKEELGALRLGLNRTKYKWNGTDDFGNKLANGVYFFRVITSKIDGEELGEYTNNGKLAGLNSYFKKGFGKLVIMR